MSTFLTKSQISTLSDYGTTGKKVMRELAANNRIGFSHVMKFNVIQLAYKSVLLSSNI